MRDWSDDLVLNALQQLPDPIGSLIKAFPGRDGLADENDWILDWFVDIANNIAGGKATDPKQVVASAARSGELALLSKPPVNAKVRLLSILPKHFRGFRGDAPRISFDADLVIVEGRNSAGKTSLSEAIEWVLTGQLTRRTSGQHGNARELADCITNEFKPSGVDTAVELRMQVDGRELVLNRVLRRDYSTSSTDQPDSELSVDGTIVSLLEERALREQLFAGVHPLLMQHNLRRFVLDDPAGRRKYFERLLQIDELTTLIEKAVVGPKRIKQIPHPGGAAGLSVLNALLEDSPAGTAVTALKKIDRARPENFPEALSRALVALAKQVCTPVLDDVRTLVGCRDIIVDMQKAQRESRLPFLAQLEQTRQQPIPSSGDLRIEAARYKVALIEFSTANVAARSIGDAQRQLARVVHNLVEVGLIDASTGEDQLCPICEHAPPTLTATRVSGVLAWTPLTVSVDAAARALQSSTASLEHEIARLTNSAEAIRPMLPQRSAINRQLSSAPERVHNVGIAAVESISGISKALKPLSDAVNLLRTAIKTHQIEAVDPGVDTIVAALSALTAAVKAHREHVGLLEEAVGAASRDDAAYRLREKWLDTASMVSAIAADVEWEQAKVSAKDTLDNLREGLISLRGEIIEHARETFSEEITRVWALLRSDSGARFSQIVIPDARGKGYKLEFELKASISDGATTLEVDALRVFSESQINVIGIAAYITRARLLGHKLLIFDDPVQSMDEEHFRSFAAKLLPALLDDGYQIIMLTHSDTFARRINDHHFERVSYATLEARSSRRKGCQVLEGNRRITERLKVAERLAGDGDLQNAWRLVRLAIERLYTLTNAKKDADFDPDTWRGLTAEDMWNKGVGEIIEKTVTGSGRTLKEILLSTVAGAHDVAATSETDVSEATSYLRSLLGPLRLGSG